jgi:hypothetical protein
MAGKLYGELEGLKKDKHLLEVTLYDKIRELERVRVRLDEEISAKILVEKALEERGGELRVVNELNAVLGRGKDLEGALRAALEVVTGLTRSPSATPMRP